MGDEKGLGNLLMVYPARVMSRAREIPLFFFSKTKIYRNVHAHELASSVTPRFFIEIRFFASYKRYQFLPVSTSHQ